MARASTILIAALAWLTVGTPVTAESPPDGGASPALAATQIEVGAGGNTVADDAATCEYGCADYREGVQICINKKQHQCGKKGWHPTGLTCADPPPVAK